VNGSCWQKALRDNAFSTQTVNTGVRLEFTYLTVNGAWDSDDAGSVKVSLYAAVLTDRYSSGSGASKILEGVTKNGLGRGRVRKGVAHSRRGHNGRWTPWSFPLMPGDERFGPKLARGSVRRSGARTVGGA